MQEHDVSSEVSEQAGSDGVEAPVGAARFLLLMLELVLVAGVVYLFDIEGRRQFFPVFCVIVGGFAVHAWLPTWYRIGFFALLSVACVPFVLGVANGFWVLGIGGGLIGICYLPIGFRMRLLMLVTAAAVLIILRAQWPLPVWPVLGSMFMFRLIVYVYSTRNAAEKPPWAESVSYFFLLPNVCFPLFPVVDFKTFRESWYNADEWEIYQRGVTWIVRGIIHLLLYRYIKTYLVPEPYELYDVTHVALFMVTNYALYLRISGQFHLITGLLHLFGFNLPRTHYHFFLASSFTDIWRRINIYWKDFMMKLFFFPTYYALRTRGSSVGPATFVGVLCVFICTWLLHSWQTFWLLGRFPITVNDAFLWLGVGLCVAANALLDSRRRERSERPAWFNAMSLSVRTVGMFALVSLFWACWTKPGFVSLLWGVMDRPGTGHGLFIVIMWMLAAVVIGAALVSLKVWQVSHRWILPVLPFRDAATMYAVGLAVVIAFASPWFGKLLDADVSQALAEFRSDGAGDDTQDLLSGYYEDLNSAAIQAGPLISSWSPTDESQRSQAAGYAKVSRPADLYQIVELIPGIKVELAGSPTSINQFGMRDRDTLTLHKPAGTIRIAMVGSSVVMGYGVSDDEAFSRLFEHQLNAEKTVGGSRYQVLNFGVGKQWSSHRLVRIQRQVLGFEPDAIYYFAHQDEFQAFANHLAKLVAHDLELPSQHLREVIRKRSITPDMAPGAIQSSLRRDEDELLSAVYRTIVDDCRSRGIVPVWIYLPIWTDTENLADKLVPLARDAGFVVCDLSFWIDGREIGELLSPGEQAHPHAGGHRLIAEALMTMLETHPGALPGGLPDTRH